VRLERTAELEEKLTEKHGQAAASLHFSLFLRHPDCFTAHLLSGRSNASQSDCVPVACFTVVNTESKRVPLRSDRTPSLQPSVWRHQPADQRYFRTSAPQRSRFIKHALHRHLLSPLAHHPLILDFLGFDHAALHRYTPPTHARPLRTAKASLVSDTRAHSTPLSSSRSKGLVWFQHPTQRLSSLQPAIATFHNSQVAFCLRRNRRTLYQTSLYPRTSAASRGCHHSQNFSPRGPHIPPRRPTA
jgi:hypothetical protein